MPIDPNTQGNPLSIDPRMLLQMIMARKAQGGAIPGAASPQAPQATPQASPQGMPGASGPQSQAQPQPGAARRLSPASPTPFNGTFGNRQGIISQLVDSAEKRGHDKKVNEAEMYYNQINSFLASGKPEDQARAQQLLDDPKVRKILKTGLDYVPLEEEVPPEAIGVHQAQQKINQKQSKLKQLQQMLTGGRQQGNAQPSPQGRAVIPQASQEAQQKYQLGEAKTGTELAHAAEYEASGKAKTATAIAEQQKADAETAKAESQRIKDEADAEKARADAVNARSQAKLYDSQAKEHEDQNPMKQRELQAHANEMNSTAAWRDAQAKFIKIGKVPGSKVQDLMKGQRADISAEIKAYRADNTEAMKELAKNPWYKSDSRLQKLQDDAGKKAKDLAAALAWYDGEGMQAVLDGKMTPPEAYAKAHRMAGIDASPSTTDPNAAPSGDLGAPPGFIKMPDGTYQEQ